VDLRLTLRSFTDEVRQHTLKSIERIVRGLAQAAGVPEDRMPIIKTEGEFTLVLYNDPELSRRVAGSLKPWLAEQNVGQEKPVMGGEDFNEYGRTPDKIAISLFWLGAVIDPLARDESDTKRTNSARKTHVSHRIYAGIIH
jgi:metal-dependent amidase/aminoacylase/carboxypeptidase family protein